MKIVTFADLKELALEYQNIPMQQSRPARGAWIETRLVIGITVLYGVAPRAGRVD